MPFQNRKRKRTQGGQVLSGLKRLKFPGPAAMIPAMQKWRWVILILLTAWPAFYLLEAAEAPVPAASNESTNTFKPLVADEKTVFAQYGGSASCQSCHEEEYNLWKTSHHALAERPVQPGRDRLAFDPSQTFHHGTQSSTVSWTNGSAVVTAVGLSHQPEAHIIDRVIGEDPLLQYLVPFPGGRWQTLEASYDPNAKEWFNSFGNEDRQPGEWGHWTGRAMNWNAMCATCHNTRLRENYEEASDSFHTAMAEPSVGCEACHGPLAAHNAWQQKFGKSGQKDPTVTKPTKTQVVDTCGACHALRSNLDDDFAPGDSFSDHFHLLKVDASERYYGDGQIRGEDYEYSSFLSSRMHASGVYCLDCHNPHSYKTILPGNWLCLRCHAEGSKTEAGTTAAPVINPSTHSHHLVHGFGTNGQPVKVELTGYNSKTVKETGGECVNCHMPQTVYMQRHWRHDHGFTSPDPLLTKQFGIPNACNRCHADKDTDWALTNCVAWYGSKMERPARSRAQVIAPVQRGEARTPDSLLALLKREDSPYWRSVVIDLLMPWADQPTVIPVLLQRLQDTNALVRGAAARSLEPALSAEVPGVVGALKSVLADPSRNVRVAAAWSLRSTVEEGSLAGRELRQYLAINGAEPVGQLNEGNYDYSRNDLPSAAKHYQTAVSWDPYAAPLRESLAVVLSQMNRSQEAVTTLEQGVQLLPQDAEMHYQLGLAYDGVGNLTNTLAQLSAAVRLDPQYVRAWYNLGLVQNQLGQTGAALSSLAEAESLDPGNERIPYAAATILAQQGRKSEAEAALKRVLAINPANNDASLLLRQLQK